MTIVRCLLMAMPLALAMCGCSPLLPNQAQGNKDILFHVSTLGALMEGVYDGEITYKELKTYGDFGLGTFDKLDGEMVQVDGKVYQIKADGRAYSVNDSMKTPFAAVTFFEADQTLHLHSPMNCAQVQEYIDNQLPTKNILYAIKVEGDFKYVKARSVPQQEKPYPKLVEAMKNQVIFEFHNAQGTMVGFRLPAYMEHINVPGYHLHFINADRRAGGHVHECRVKNVKIEIDYMSRFLMTLPDSNEFYKVDLN